MELTAIDTDCPPYAQALPSPAARHESRRKFRRLYQKTPARDGPADSGMLDLLNDDVLRLLYRHLARIPTGARAGTALQSAVRLTGRSVLGLRLSCTRLNAIFCDANAVRREMHARAATQIVPASLHLDEFPYTKQVKLETRSSSQLNVLRRAISGMAVHCAGECCLGQRRAVNRELGAIRTEKCPARRIVALSRSSATLSACGEEVFVSRRERLSKRDFRGGDRAEQYAAARGDVLAHLRVLDGAAVEQSAALRFDTDELSTPQVLRASSEGVALIRGVHSWEVGKAFSVLHVWRDGGLHGPAETPYDLQAVGAINPQECWWTTTEDGRRLAVLWSTAYLHPSGHMVGASADEPGYGIALYDADMEIETFCGPFAGKAQTAHPTADGAEAVVLVRSWRSVGQVMGLVPQSATFLHHIDGRVSQIDHSSALARKRHHALDQANSPSAVAIAPGGDCVVAVHRMHGSVILEVLTRTTGDTFASVQSLDITWATAMGSGEPGPFDVFEDAEAAASALSLPYAIEFSPCGRFVVVADQRPRFGLACTNHALVVLDCALRYTRRGLRALPLASVDQATPRSVHWTERGLIIEARHGALMMVADE